MTIAKQQLHLTGERYLPDGSRNVSPDRRDGLALPPPPERHVPPLTPKRPRVARAMVSTARKGAIPTTLGGKLSPVSILSRREFGLRVLRK